MTAISAFVDSATRSRAVNSCRNACVNDTSKELRPQIAQIIRLIDTAVRAPFKHPCSEKDIFLAYAEELPRPFQAFRPLLVE